MQHHSHAPTRATPPLASAEAPIHKPRANGWTLERQAAFLDALASGGCVLDACRAVGISSTSAYRFRARPDAHGFAQAWDTAQRGAHAHVEGALLHRALHGWTEPVFYGGEVVGHRQRHDNRLLLKLIDRLDRARERASAQAAARPAPSPAPAAGKAVTIACAAPPAPPPSRPASPAPAALEQHATQPDRHADLEAVAEAFGDVLEAEPPEPAGQGAPPLFPEAEPQPSQPCGGAQAPCRKCITSPSCTT